jgi:hypothetical protein
MFEKMGEVIRKLKLRTHSTVNSKIYFVPFWKRKMARIRTDESLRPFLHLKER